MHRSHRVLGFALAGIVAVTMMAFGAALVAAQGSPPPQSSHTLIQNMSEDELSVVVAFIDTDGTTAHSVGFSLPGNGSRVIHSDDYPELGNQWMGSQVVYSSGPLITTVVLYGYPSAHAIYEGYGDDQGATELRMPSIHWNPLGQFSKVAIQNADTEDADVEITYYDRGGNAVAGPFTATIPPGASEIRDSQTDCAGGVCGVPPEGSMRVVCTNGKKIVSAVLENVHDGTYAYQALPPAAADTSFLLPSIHHNPGGQFSHVLVQNASSTFPTTVTIDYLDQAGVVVDTFTKTLQADGAYTFHTTNEVPAEEPTNLGDEGAARITSDTADVVVTVVETVLGRPYSYNGFNSATGGDRILLPSVHRNPLGQYSHILVQNTSDSISTTLTITYYRPDGTVADTFSRDVEPGGAYTFHTTHEVPADEPTNMPDEGSAIVTSSDADVVAVCVETVHMVPGAYQGFED
jgi:hypothetical protein